MHLRLHVLFNSNVSFSGGGGEYYKYLFGDSLYHLGVVTFFSFSMFLI